MANSNPPKLPAEYTRKGHPLRGGRKKGTPNRSTLLRSELLQIIANGDASLASRLDRFKKLIGPKSPPHVRVIAEKILLEQDWGKPAQRIEVSGQLDVTSAIILAFARIRGGK